MGDDGIGKAPEDPPLPPVPAAASMPEDLPLPPVPAAASMPEDLVDPLLHAKHSPHKMADTQSGARSRIAQASHRGF